MLYAIHREILFLRAVNLVLSLFLVLFLDLFLFLSRECPAANKFEAAVLVSEAAEKESSTGLSTALAV